MPADAARRTLTLLRMPTRKLQRKAKPRLIPTQPPDANMGMGMMAGMGGPGRKGKAPAKAEVKYEPTVWGRYAKVLLSSTEFIFIN